MKTLLVSALAVLIASLAQGPSLFAVTNAPVEDANMQRIYDEAKTPFKYGVVLSGGAEEKVDCPNVFRQGEKWFMLFIAFDGSGYETRLAESTNLLQWKVLGPILKRHGTGWDAEQAAGGIALVDNRWEGTWELQPYDGKYWLSYLGGKSKGYETPPLSIGLASSENPASTEEWARLQENPVLSPGDSDARWFERDTLFKSHVFRDPDKTLGAQFVMAYNARAPKDSERIGLAISQDLKHWQRYGDAHVLENVCPPGPKHGVISGDPQIVKLRDLWVMFYFGAFWKPGAFDTFAASHDLVHWTKWTGPDLIAPSEPWDKQFAHKPWLVRKEGVVYHFYCAVGDQGRVIALATSKGLRPAKSAQPPPIAAPRYKIAVCDWMILKRQKLGAFKLTKDIGADGVEVDMGSLGERDTFENQLANPTIRQQFLEQASELKVEISSLAMSGFYGQSLAERPTVPRMLQDCLDTMKQMNVKVAFLPLGVQGDLVKHPEVRPLIVQRLKAIAPKAEQAGVIIGLETALDAAGDVELLKEIGSPAIRIYFNFENALQAGRDLPAELRLLGKDRICQIHCTDVDGVWLQDNQRLDLPKVKATLDEMGWTGWLVIERSRSAKDPKNVKWNFGANTAYLKKVFQ